MAGFIVFWLWALVLCLLPGLVFMKAPHPGELFSCLQGSLPGGFENPGLKCEDFHMHTQSSGRQIVFICRINLFGVSHPLKRTSFLQVIKKKISAVQVCFLFVCFSPHPPHTHTKTDWEASLGLFLQLCTDPSSAQLLWARRPWWPPGAPWQTPRQSLGLEREALLAASLHLSAWLSLPSEDSGILMGGDSGIGEEMIMPSCPSQ